MKKYLFTCFTALICYTTSAQTLGTPVLVHDANLSGDGGASNITSVGDNVFYEANGTLWMYDGSSASDISPASGAYQFMIGQLNDELYYVINDGSNILVRHNGTTQTAVGNLGGSGAFEELSSIELSGELYFVADDGSTGSEVWKTDGSTATRITDINSGGASAPQNLTVINDKIYFTATDGTSRKLYDFNSTNSAITEYSGGSAPYDEIPEGENFSIALLNDDIYFPATKSGMTKMWYADASGGNPQQTLLFINGGLSSHPRELTVLDNRIMFSAEFTSGGLRGLYWLEAPNSKARVNAITEPEKLSISQGSLFVSGIVDGDRQMRYYGTDSGGDYFLYSMFQGGGGIEDVKGYAFIEDSIYTNYLASASANATVTNSQLVSQIGTKNGAHNNIKFYFVNDASTPATIDNVTVHGTTLFFEGDDGTNGKELWMLRPGNFSPVAIEAEVVDSIGIAENTYTFDLANRFTDGDGDDLTITALSGNASIATTSVVGDELTVTLISKGTVTITVTADDGFGGTGDFDLNLKVTDPFLVYSEDGFAETVPNEGEVSGSIVITLNGEAFNDPLVHETDYTIDNLPEGLAPDLAIDASGQVATLTLSGNAVDHDDSDDISGLVFTFANSAFDSGDASIVTGATSTDSEIGISYLDNPIPVPSLPYPMNDVIRVTNASPVYFDLDKYFDIQDGFTLTYSATSSDESVGTVEVTGDVLKLTIGTIGTTDVEITAGAPGGETGTETFTLDVRAPYLTFGEYVNVLEETNLTVDTAAIMEFPWSGLFSPDGTKYFRIGRESVVQSELNEAFDINAGFTVDYYASTGAYLGRTNEFEFNIEDQIGNLNVANGLTFGTDGLKMFVVNNNNLLQYSLTEPYELRSTVTYDGSIALPGTDDVYDLRMMSDGGGLTTTDLGTNEVHEFIFNTVNSPLDGFSSSSSISLATAHPKIAAANFSNDGSQLIVSDRGGFDITLYDLTTPYKISDGVELAGSITLTSEYGDINDAFFGPDGKMFAISHAGSSTLAGYLIQHNHNDRSGGFSETEANDGTLTGEMLISLTGDTFVNAAGTLTSGTHFTIDNLPAGLTSSVSVNLAGNQATLILSGQATNHSAADNIAALQITFTDAAFVANTAGNFQNAVAANTEFNISYFNNSASDSGSSVEDPEVIYVELFPIFGDLDDLLLSVEVTEVIEPTEAAEALTSFNQLSSIKDSREVEIASTIGTSSSVEGQEEPPIAEVEIVDGVAAITPIRDGQLNIVLTAQAPTSDNGAIPAAVSVDFDYSVAASGPYVIYSGEGFEEQISNDGSVEGTLSVNVYLDELVNAGGVLSEGTHFSIADLPIGLTPSLTVNDAGSQATLSITDQAEHHYASESLDDLVITFTDAAFVGGDASIVTNALNGSTGTGLAFEGCGDLYEYQVEECGLYEFAGEMLDTTGEYEAVFTSLAGCDSLVQINLTIKEFTTSEETISTCASYDWNGLSLTSSGTYEEVFVNTAGCDSIATLSLTILESSNSAETISTCNSYDWNGQILTSTGTYEEVFTNAVGCDSTAVLNLTILDSEECNPLSVVNEIEIIVSPNPTTEKISVQGVDVGDKYLITDLVGKIVQVGIITESAIDLNVKTGAYLLSIPSRKKVVRVVKIE